MTVAGEADALRRALENLLENAEVHGEGDVAVSLTLEDGRAVLAVTDDGPGFAPGDADHAFERFWRGPGARGRPGSGLGLAIVRATAERHGGTVDRERRDRADRHPGGGRAERRGDVARVAAGGTIGTTGPQVSAGRSDLPADAVNTPEDGLPPKESP